MRNDWKSLDKVKGLESVDKQDRVFSFSKCFLKHTATMCSCFLFTPVDIFSLCLS